MNNQAFKRKIEERGVSLYAVSKGTGIPYMTINKLAHDKLEINQCAFDTVARLAAFFGCDVTELTNPVPIMNNVTGKYNGMRYEWIATAETTTLNLYERGKLVESQYFKAMIGTEFYKAYIGTAECYIDVYQKEKAAEEALWQLTH